MTTDDQDVRSLESLEKPSNFIMARPGLMGALLLGPFALALLCYTWAFCSQSHKLGSFREFLCLTLKRRERELRGTQNIYFSAFSLLLFDGFTFIFGLVWFILVFCTRVQVVQLIFFFLWLAFRFLSVCQHLITALISILFAYHPSWGHGLRSISKGLNLVPFILIVLSFRVHDNIVIGVDVYNFLLMVGIVVSCCRSTSSPMAKQRQPIGVLALSMYFLVCLPNAVLNCLLAASDYYLTHALYVLLITNFYIVMSALLFCLVLKMEEDDRREPEYECAITSA